MNLFKSKKVITIPSLIKLNSIAMWLHLAQGVAMVALVSFLGTDASYDVTVNYLSFNESTQSLAPATKDIFSINFAVEVPLTICQAMHRIFYSTECCFAV